MAIELFSENSGMSPRISFSHDLCLSEIIPTTEPHHFLRSNSSRSGGSIDFDFPVRKSFDQDSSSADELFSDGKILPTEIKKKTPPLPPMRPTDNPPPPPRPENPKNESYKVIIDEAGDFETINKQNSKSFWRFKRSSSLNCGSGYGRRSLCPLPLLSRSNSTGSAPNVKRAPLVKEGSNYSNHKDNNKQHKQGSVRSSHTTSSSSGYQKPPLKKNYGNRVRVNPVLNVPSGNLFGLGSIFFNGKDKNKKK